MKYFHVSLVTVKSLNLLFGNRDKDKHKVVKGSDKEEMRTIFSKVTTIRLNHVLHLHVLTSSCL